ncbi:MAG TPA: lysophospholipid acyltransferase family protein [Candidatus Limnocylindrales bacterium]|nr:lysophospholipid acyltransferase family protein [Candidatus Limnocylindrales bacterium]
MIRALVMFLYFGLALLFVMPWFILWTLLSGNPNPMYRMAMAAVRLAPKLVGVRVRVEGLENIPPGVCIFAANHISTIDPLAFIPSIPRRVAILVKKELFRVPFLGSAMSLADFVSVDRSDREAAASSVDRAVLLLKQGRSFAVYPEGTRSPDGRLRPFKKGTFIMAIQAGVPIVPVSIVGAQKLMEKGAFAIRPGEVLVRFGAPADSSKYTLDQRGDLLAYVQSLVAAGLPPDQQPAA